MAQAALNIEGMAFCTLDIEGSPMPPSMNLIENIWIMEGFGMGLPILKMSLYDEQETLSRDLALKNGTSVKLRMGKTAEEAAEYKFLVFGWTRPRNSSGKVLHVVGLYDAPKFGAGAFAESFDDNSSAVMQQLAERSGLQYEGPAQNPDDTQIWLNLNTTRLGFSEDVAMHGYVNEYSCMARCVRMDGTLVYKDLMALLKDEPAHTLVHNKGAEGALGKSVDVRSAKDMSVSGLWAHYVNYGHKQFGHDFSEETAGYAIENMSVEAPSAGVPVSADVLAQLKERGARVSYSGLDPGTGPDEGFNVHEHYEQAYYQNVRLLALFSERVEALTDSPTTIKSFTSIEYQQGAGAKGDAQPATSDITGRYIVGGKTIMLKKGKKYAEVIYLYRPFLSEEGNPAGSAKPKTTVNASNSGVDTSSRNFV